MITNSVTVTYWQLPLLAYSMCVTFTVKFHYLQIHTTHTQVILGAIFTLALLFREVVKEHQQCIEVLYFHLLVCHKYVCIYYLCVYLYMLVYVYVYVCSVYYCYQCLVK